MRKFGTKRKVASSDLQNYASVELKFEPGHSNFRGCIQYATITILKGLLESHGFHSLCLCGSSETLEPSGGIEIWAPSGAGPQRENWELCGP